MHKHCSARVHIKTTNELYFFNFNLEPAGPTTVKLVLYPQSIKILNGRNRHTEFRRPTCLIRTQLSNWPRPA
jgi:hypothetical protein